jgi:hypothetical protein
VSKAESGTLMAQSAALAAPAQPTTSENMAAFKIFPRRLANMAGPSRPRNLPIEISGDISRKSTKKYHVRADLSQNGKLLKKAA